MMLPSLLSSMYARDTAGAQGFSYCRYSFVLRKREALLRRRPIDRSGEAERTAQLTIIAPVRTILRMSASPLDTLSSSERKRHRSIGRSGGRGGW